MYSLYDCFFSISQCSSNATGDVDDCIAHNANCDSDNEKYKKGERTMIKKMHVFMLSAIFEKLARISYDLHNYPYCLFFFGEPNIDIPEE